MGKTAYCHDGGRQAGTICLRPIAEEDTEFLHQVYASTRLEEMAATGWSKSQIESFLRMQFSLQRTQYTQNYPGAYFEVILAGPVPAGRLYVDRKDSAMQVIDIALLPEFRGKGIGGSIMRRLVEEADAKGLTITLHVEMNNPILPFYRTLGFREIELRGIYYYMEKGVMKGT